MSKKIIVLGDQEIEEVIITHCNIRGSIKITDCRVGGNIEIARNVVGKDILCDDNVTKAFEEE